MHSYEYDENFKRDVPFGFGAKGKWVLKVARPWGIYAQAKKNLDYFQALCISPTPIHVQKLYISSSNSTPIFKMLKTLGNKKFHDKNIEKGPLEQIGLPRHLNSKE